MLEFIFITKLLLDYYLLQFILTIIFNLYLTYNKIVSLFLQYFFNFEKCDYQSVHRNTLVNKKII